MFSGETGDKGETSRELYKKSKKTASLQSPMGSGSFLSRKTLVHFPDVFLFSPQFLHRAFSLSNKVNKCQ